jgi:NADH-quinone oxidoreductase subunit L
LSVHLGAFLLLRVGPLLDQSPLLCVLIVIVGLATAAIAALAGAVQADIKSSLTFASLVQVGIIVAEIGVGLRWIPLVHLVGHAFLRTLQFLRAPTLLHDYHELENAIGGRLHHRSGFLARLVGPELGLRLYRFALERGGLDAAIDRFAVRPFLGLFVRLDRFERRITGLLAGRAAERPPKSGDSLEEVA